MMQFIELLYITAAIIAISGCVPQVMRLLRTKQSEGFHLRTWATWTLTQMVTFVYVISIGSWIMAVVNAVWVVFYAAMTVLIVRYRSMPVITDPQVAPTVVAAQLQE